MGQIAHLLQTAKEALLPYATWSDVAMAATAVYVAFAIPMIVKRLTAGRLPPKTSVLVDLPLPILGPLCNLVAYQNVLNQMEQKEKYGDIMRIPLLTTAAIIMVNTDGVRLGITCRQDGKKVLGTQTLESMNTLWGRKALVNLRGPEHGRVKKLLHPTVSVKRVAKLLVQIWDGTFAAPLCVPGSAFSRGKKARRDLLPIIQEIIEERRASSCEGMTDTLSEMIKQGQLSDEEIRDQMVTIMLAGYETTAALTVVALHLLPQFPQVLAKLRREQDSIQGPLDWAKVESMAYMHNFLKEVLRHHSPALGFSRTITDTFHVGGYTFPKGYILQYAISAVQKRCEGPRGDHPERFEDLASPVNRPYGFTPFGGGEYLCLGERFARMEAAVLLRTLIQRYNWEHAAKDPRVWYSPVFMKFTDDLPLIFTKV
ncbi:cytochrome P450 [Tribonema minus]|uniref:Cytochrome P450 n=1 Tax=Tribonema minus TaxID=303371 RepID=A0A835YHG0_9STRA|nr:cytochrome P450 [Tribonema minus]